MAEENEELEDEGVGGEAENALAMSDEDIMNMTEPPGSGEGDGVLLDSDASEQSPEGGGSEDPSGEDPGDPSGDDTGSEDGAGDGGDNLETGEDDGLQKEGQAPSQEEVATAPTGDEGKPGKPVKKEAVTDPARTGEADDPKDQLAQLFAPFKANGRQMQVSNVKDAMHLMQMGANYNKKMAGLKPALRVVKMLENNDLLDEDKINHLIDLSKKKPEAIAHLVKESGIDPIDIDTSSDEEYKPETYTVNDQDVRLDAVLDDIRDTPQYQDTMNVIGNKWDQKSRQALYEEPNTIRTLNEHMGAGIFSELMGVVENQRALGRLTGMSDIEAYQHVGDVIKANGGFDAKPAPKTPDATGQQISTATKRTADPKLKNRKRAAAAPKGAPSSAPAEYNPLSLSDEEFEKVAGGQFI